MRFFYVYLFFSYRWIDLKSTTLAWSGEGKEVTSATYVGHLQREGERQTVTERESNLLTQ